MDKEKHVLAPLKLIGLGILVATVASAVTCGTLAPLPINEETRASNSNNSTSARSNTLIVRLRENNPIQEIIIDEGFASGGTEPIFEIDGNPGGSGNGTLRIGILTMDTVDARRLEIRDTQVVSSNMTNVVAHDDELDLDIQTVTVVFVEQGALSKLSHKNFRVDRIRILGVGGDVDTHLERLTVTRSSFSGRIRIEDVKIQNLILKNVSLED